MINKFEPKNIVNKFETKPKDTSGFYKAADGRLLFAPNAVWAPDYDLFRKDNVTYDYPVQGWYWFDSEKEARAFFDVPVQ